MAGTNYIWDVESDTYLMEADDSAAVTAKYTHEAGVFGELISQHRSEQESYYHFGSQASMRQLTDAVEHVTDEALYAAFGEPVAVSGATEHNFFYGGAAGYYRCTETGALYVRRRTYAPERGQWLSNDRSVAPNDLDIKDVHSGYAYTGNAPTTLVDPSGQSVIVIVFVFSAIRIIPRRRMLGRRSCNDTPEMNWDFRVWYPISPTGNIRHGAPCDGYIVQKVRVECAITGCCPVPSEESDDFTYFEAWFVPQGEQIPALEKLGQATDTARFLIPADTEGRYLQRGEIRFYCMDEVDSPIRGSLGTGPLDAWTPREYGKGVCNTRSGRLPSTREAPPFWASSPVAGPAFRRFSVEWSCCLDESGHDFRRGSFVVADADPLEDSVQGGLYPLK